MTSAKRDSASRQFLHISFKWITIKNSRLLGITVSSSKDRGAVEISKRLSIKTYCNSLFEMWNGDRNGFFMTLGQINQVTALSPVLESLLTQAIASQYQHLT